MARPRIIVIDDDPLFRSLIVSQLRKSFLVSVAAEGAEGYYKSLEHPPDIAVVDIQMPGWDGLKTLKAFRAHPALCNIPIVILTGDAIKETVMSALSGGANDYIIKTTFSKEDLLQKLCRWLPTSMVAELAAAEAAPPTESRGQDETVIISRSQAEALPRPRTVPENKLPVPAGPVDSRQMQEMMDDWE